MFPILSIIGMLSGCGAHNPDATLSCPTITEKDGRHQLTEYELSQLRQNCSAYDLVGLQESMNTSWYYNDEETSYIDEELMPSERCIDTLLMLTNLSKDFQEVQDREEEEQKLALIRGLHMVSALPLKSDGLILGVKETECQALTVDYLGAEISDDITADIVFEGFINETAVSNLIEYTRKFHVNTDKDSVASERNGKITISSAYRPRFPVDEAGTILHEARHNEDPLFSDSSSHTKCQGVSCDAGIFGSYGTEMRYHDALIRGSGQAQLVDGRYVLDDNQIEYSLSYMCKVVKTRIKHPPVELTEIFSEYNCNDFFYNDIRDQFLLEHYGFIR